jgi:hypothetical protein
MHRNDDACYAVSANLIFPINYHCDIPHLEKKNLLWQSAANILFKPPSLLESVILTEF